MVQNKLPLINSAHGSETRNIINELIKLFNGMGYTYDQALQKSHDVLDEAKKTNDMNESVQQQINTLIAESGTSDAEVLQARIDAEGNEYPVLKDRLDENDSQLAQITHKLDSDAILQYENFMGEKAIPLIGDSISNGATSYDIPNNSYVGILRKMIRNEFGGDNYGFVLAYDKTGAGETLSLDYHRLTHARGASYKTGEFYSFTDGYYEMDDGTYIEYELSEPNKYFSVFYGQEPDGGNIEVSVNGIVKTIINTYGVTSDQFKRSEMIDISNEPLPMKITVKHLDGTKTRVIGIGYYNDPEGVVFNNYGRSGLKLAQLSDDALIKSADAKFAFFALGHNDRNVTPIDEFTRKLNVLKTAYQQNGTYVVVVDMLFTQATSDPWKRAIIDFADGLKGIHINVIKDVFNASGSLSLVPKYFVDGSHPSPLGHQLIAEHIARRLNFNIQTKGAAINLDEANKKVDELRVKEIIAQTSGETGWTVVLNEGLLNGWQNQLDNHYSGFKYRKVNGVVYFEGLLIGGTYGTVAYKLPEGFRPQLTKMGTDYMKSDMLQFTGYTVSPNGNITVTGKDYPVSYGVNLSGSFPLLNY